VSTRADERWLEVRIADTGDGIPAHIQERIFDPFFTTKGVGRGTGQGLAIARSVVVDKHQGRLRFVSDPGRGTTFVIELPLHRPEPPPAGTNEVIPER
jgi:signal transduction histidine kinase